MRTHEGQPFSLMLVTLPTQPCPQHLEDAAFPVGFYVFKYLLKIVTSSASAGTWLAGRVSADIDSTLLRSSTVVLYLWVVPLGVECSFPKGCTSEIYITIQQQN